MIRYLLTEKNKHKGNLHCHTTLSDGSMTPQEIADAYREHGYDFVALSDHDHYYAHPELQRDDFLVLYAYEQGVDSPKREPFGPGKCYHFNFFAKSPDQKALLIPPKPDYYDKDALNDFIKAIKDQGFLCSYNHPYWSLQNFEDYTPLKHIDFLEIFNYGCYIGDGLHENQVNVYDDMLRWGHCEKLYCTMTDDNHDRHLPGDPLCDSFGGWVMTGGELSYAGIIHALETGDFYCSNGPEILSLGFDAENLTVHVKTSPAYSISVGTATRHGALALAADGKLLTEAELKIWDSDVYFRVEVTGPDGKRANSIAYYLTDFTE